MEKNIRLVQFPFSPWAEVVDKMVMRVSGYYTQDFVSISFNPKTHEAKSIDRSRRIQFDRKNDTHKVRFDRTTYNVKLVSIGEERIGAEAFRAFEFMVTW